MRTVTYRLGDLHRAVIPIGFVGENEHSRILFDCLKVFEEYPSAVAALTVQPPYGEAYPAVVVRDGNIVYWDIYDSDLTQEGRGEAQLTFSQGDVVVKSFIVRTSIERSLMGTGDVPEPLDDFLARAGEALTAIPQTIDDALAAAKASGEFDGRDGQDGQDGADGFSPTVAVTEITGGHQVAVTDAEGTTAFDVMDGVNGQNGADGAPGADGFSPRATVSKSGKVATITVTDAAGTTTATVSDGEDGTSAIDDTAGAGDTDKVWSADKSASEASQLFGAIQGKQDAPETAGTAGQVLSLDNNLDPVWTTPQSGGGSVTDVQVNGTSVVTSGVANVPLAKSNVLGVGKFPGSDYGVSITNDGTVYIHAPVEARVKAGTNAYSPIVPNNQHIATFYGLAKASGDTTQASSSNSVGTYTEDALSKISDMLNAPVSVSGSTPSITAKAGVRYICGEVSTLTIVVPSTGIIDVTFESGSTATVLTVTPPTGVTMKWANGFDPTALEANTTYEINIMDGCLGVAGSWT